MAKTKKDSGPFIENIFRVPQAIRDAQCREHAPKLTYFEGGLVRCRGCDADEKRFFETEQEVEHFLKFGKDASPLIVLVDF